MKLFFISINLNSKINYLLKSEVKFQNKFFIKFLMLKMLRFFEYYMLHKIAIKISLK